MSSTVRTPFRAFTVAAILATLLALTLGPGAGAASHLRFERIPAGPKAVLRAQHTTVRTPPVLRPPTVTPATPTATFVMNYVGFPVDNLAKNAFQAAVDIWASTIVSSHPINVTANWTPLGTNVLGSAGSGGLIVDASDDMVYPMALAEARCSCDINIAGNGTTISPDPDIIANFNSSFADWYYDTNALPPMDKYDLESVVLHELGHGLGFSGSFTLVMGDPTQAQWGFTNPLTPPPIAGKRWDFNEWSAATGGKQLTDGTLAANPSAALKAELSDGSVYMAGANLLAANGGNRVKLFAPSTYTPGSTNSHWDEATYPAPDPNSLMTPGLNNGEAIHDQGPLMKALFQDIGWSVVGVDTTKPAVGVPGADFRINVAVGTTATPIAIKVAFTASDLNGIASTQLQQKIGAGAFTNVPLSPPNATSANISVTASAANTQTFRARATDSAVPANTSAYSVGPPFKVQAYQNAVAPVVQAGVWSTQALASFYGGSVRYSTSAAAKQTLTIVASDFAYVTTKANNRGKVKIFIDGLLKKTLDLYSATTKYRQVVYAISFAGPAASHTIEIRPAATKNAASTGLRVDFDAYLAMTP